ncbi:MAG TPA: holo-ACP synthase [Nevskiaceae bacterium]
MPAAASAIYGVGADLLRVERGQRLWERYGERAARKLLHPVEHRLLVAGRDPGRLLARSFAVKEAFVKALGTGFAGIGIDFNEVGAARGPDGQPRLAYSKRLAARLAARGVGAGHVSISDEGGLVIAFVVLERAPDGDALS